MIDASSGDTAAVNASGVKTLLPYDVKKLPRNPLSLLIIFSVSPFNKIPLFSKDLFLITFVIFFISLFVKIFPEQLKDFY